MKKILFIFMFFYGLAYGNAFDIKENFLNQTDAAKWVDPMTGNTYFSGPNIEYRFAERGKSTVPWVQFQLPSVKIGCNGLSIKGGFMALLGLDDIKLQLEDAGASFAWGTLMVIEISMPDVAAVFHKLQQWIRQLQALMQNACQAGQVFGRAVGLDQGLGIFENNILNEGAGKLLDSMNSMEKKIGLINKADDNKTKKDLVSGKLHRVGSGVSFLSMTLGRSIGKCSREELGDVEMLKFSTHDAIKGEIGSCDISSKDENFERNIISYQLSRILFGELVVTHESIAPILENFTADGLLSTDAMRKTLTGIVAHSEAPFGEIEYSILAPVISDAREAANWLVHGNNGKKVTIPNTQGVYIYWKPDPSSGSMLVSDSNASVSGSSSVFEQKDAEGQPLPMAEIKALYITRAEEASSGDIEIEWDGLFNESKKNIIKVLENGLKAKVGDTLVSNYFGDVEVPEVNLEEVKTPLLVSNMFNYLQILQENVVNEGSVAGSMPLIDMLAQYNAELFAEQLLGEMNRQIMKAESGPGLITTPQTTLGFENFRKRNMVLYTEIRKELNEMKKETTSNTQKVPEVFKNLNIRLKENRTKRFGDGQQ